MTWYSGTGERTEFLTSNTDGLNTAEHWTGRVLWPEGGDTGATTKIYVRDDDYSNMTIGSVLVRAASPVPASIWLLVSGLFPLVSLARRK